MTLFFSKILVLFFWLSSTCLLAQSSMPSDFPKPVNTGNVVEDRNHYAKEKEAWIINHPDKYAEMGGELPISLPKEEQIKPPSPREMPNLNGFSKHWQLTDAKVYQQQANGILVLNLEETDAYQKFSVANISIGFEKEQMFLKIGEGVVVGNFQREGDKIAVVFQDKECSTCKKDMTFLVIKEDNQRLILDLLSEDEGDNTLTRLDFLAK